MELLVFWIVGAAVIGLIASRKDKGFLGYFLLASKCPHCGAELTWPETAPAA